MIFKPSMIDKNFRSFGKCLSYLRFNSIGDRISQGGKIFPYLEELKHGKGKLIGPKRERSWKLCVKPYKWKTVSNDYIIRPWLNLNLENSIEDCDLFFYDDVNGTSGKETGYQLPHAVVKNTIKLLERMKRDRKDEYLEHDNDPICNLEYFLRSKRESQEEKNGDRYQKRSKNHSNLSMTSKTLSNYYGIITDHLDKVDELLESRSILEEMLDSLRKDGLDQRQSEA